MVILSLFMKGTMESGSKHYEKKKQSLEVKKKMLCHMSHDHTIAVLEVKHSNQF